MSTFKLPEFTEEQYIKLFDRIGHDHFAIGSDEQLREWGNSEEKIRKIKIGAIQWKLDFHREGIEFYLLLKEMEELKITE